MRKFWTVLKKELRDCVRDKRSIVMMLLPVIVFPLLLTFTNQQFKAADEELSTQLALATNDKTAIVEIIDVLSASGLEVDVVESQNAADDLKSGKVMLVLDKTESGYHILYDQNSIKSSKAVGIVSLAIESQKTAKIHEILNLHGENVDFLNEFNYSAEDVTSSEQDVSASLLAMIGPMAIVLFIASGGTSVALDLFCGEKERGSLEGVLATQVNRKSLYYAKVTTVFIFGCFSTLISLGAYLLSFVLSGDIGANTSVGMGWQQTMLLFVVCGAFALFTSAVISALAISAKTVKEGALRISLFTTIPSLVGSVSLYMQTGTSPAVINFVPIINVIGSLKSIFINVIQPEQMTITIFSTIFYGVIVLLIGQRAMNSEKILAK